MTEMRVKDLVEVLLKIDQELPIHKRSGTGEFPPVDSDYLGHWLNYDQLMRSKDDPTYFARTEDKVWRNNRERFGEEFKAVVIW